MKWRWRVGVATVVAIAAAAAASGAGARVDGGQARPKLKKPEIVLGLITDITTFRDFGIRTKHAVELAVRERNARGGINGYRVRVVFGDDASDPQQAALLTRKMAQDDKVWAIIGPFSSGSCEVAFPLANQLQVPIIASTSAKPGLAGKNRPWAFRNTATDDKVLKPALQAFVRHYKPTRVAIAADTAQPVTRTTGTVLFPSLAADMGLQVVNAKDPVTWSTGAQDLSAQVTKLKSLNVQALLLGATAPDAGRLAREMKRQGLNIPAIGGVSMFGTELVSIGGAAANGWYTAGVFWPGNPNKKVRAWVRKMQKINKRLFPLYPEVIPDQATWYDTTNITMDIAAKAHLTGKSDVQTARTAIRDGWSRLHNYRGISGVTSITSDGEGDKQIYVVRVAKGKFVRAK